MNWNNEDKEALLAFKTAVDSDEVKIKEQIKQVLLNNKFIIHVLNNKELEENEAEPDDYYGINIKPAFIIPDTQTHVDNFLCYEVGFRELDRYNKSVKLLQITFYILCNEGKDNLIDSETGIARHDLLSALIENQFNHKNYFGGKIRIVSNIPSTTDSHYVTRTMIFEQTTDNALVTTRNGNPKMTNKEIHTLG